MQFWAVIPTPRNFHTRKKRYQGEDKDQYKFDYSNLRSSLPMKHPFDVSVNNRFPILSRKAMYNYQYVPHIHILVDFIFI